MSNKSQVRDRPAANLLRHKQHSSPPGLPIPKSLDLTSSFNRALAFHRAGQLAEADNAYRQLLKAKPDHFDSRHLLGVSCLQRGNYPEAVRQIDMALKVNPNAAFAHNNRGNALKALNRLGEALDSHDRAIALKPDYAEAHYNRGNALMELSRFDDALESYDRAIALEPGYADAIANRGVALMEMKRPVEAVESHNKAITLKPCAETYNNRGVALMDLSRPDKALASFEHAIALKPDYADAVNNRGNALKELNRFEAALESHDKAIALNPDFAAAFYNRGNALKELKRLDEALAAYDRAIALKSDYAEAHWNESLLRLLIGDFERGWTKYEWRWRNDPPASLKRHFSQPPWLGADGVEGKTILLHGEQGLGDIIQFCRYAPLVEARGARVILEVQESLLELLSGLAGVSRCVAKGDSLPEFDLHCPLLTLPLAFGTRLETIPGTTPYLFPPAHAVTRWQARLGPKYRPRIGLVWSGEARHKNDLNRSIGLRSLLPLLDIPATFVSLQKDVRASDAPMLRERADILHVGGSLRSFADTAALVSQLDLVITVDTSVAHLAGALGRPVWILLPFIPDWRWLLDRADSPWYPTARLFRQTHRKEWQEVIESVHAELSHLVENRQTGADAPLGVAERAVASESRFVNH